MADNTGDKRTGSYGTLRERFQAAVRAGVLGTQSNLGVTVTQKEFRTFFSTTDSNYASSFLPAATIEPGCLDMRHTKYLFRIGYGVYLVHAGVFEEE
ncbi:hypothetical protein MNBD_GAMMA10-707 [hydrothermal vent metagenome]|uniref:Uncharacterized protein n=1 Tax=hydrothermal vent metagenome TaxID=652676 RepID=A0A3B0XJ44_9ZZZZ